MSEVAKCPSCEKENPVGAKFCSGCAATLSAETRNSGGQEQRQPPPPPPNPGVGAGLGGMMRQAGGKVESRQVNGEQSVIYSALTSFLEQQEHKTIKSEFAPQQISASVGFKDFWTTLNSWVSTDCEINITPAGAGVCNVSVGAKIDWSSTLNLWGFSIAMLFMLIFFFNNAYGGLTMLYLIAFAAGSVLNVFMMNAKGPKALTEQIFSHLAGADSKGAPRVDSDKQSAQPGTLAPTPSPRPEIAAAANPDDHRARLQKLKTLLEDDLISQTEFDTRRQEILSEI